MKEVLVNTKTELQAIAYCAVGFLLLGKGIQRFKAAGAWSMFNQLYEDGEIMTADGTKLAVNFSEVKNEKKA